MPTPNVTRAHDGRLSRLSKFAFGAGDLGPAVVSAIQSLFLFAFLINVAGLRPAAAGTVLLIVKIWDAVNDPLVGTLSDRTRSGRGRRRPWMLFGAIPFGVAFFLLWLVPPLSPTGLFWYYLIVLILLDTMTTVVNVPYAALTAELTQDYDERTNLNSYRFGFSILGSVTAAALHGIIVGRFEDVYVGHAVSAGIWAVVISAPFFFTVAFIREPERAPQSHREGLGFWAGIKIAFGNRPFVYVTLIYLLSWLTFQFIQNNLLLYVTYWVGAADMFPFLVLTVQVSAIIFLLVWTWVSQKAGKTRVYFWGMSFFVAVLAGIYFLQPGQVGLLFVLGALAGVGVAIVYLVPWSMLPDVIELDELETGQRREGVFYGFFVFLQKLGLSLGVWVSGLILDYAGYIRDAPGQATPVQPPDVLQALRVLVGPIPAVVLLLSFIVVAAYPITREKHAEIRARLAVRGGSGGS